jgi:hypothetical protein
LLIFAFAVVVGFHLRARLLGVLKTIVLPGCRLFRGTTRARATTTPTTELSHQPIGERLTVDTKLNRALDALWKPALKPDPNRLCLVLLDRKFINIHGPPNHSQSSHDSVLRHQILRKTRDLHPH